ncbi:OmpH family outer membrane protein [Aquidulcibacter sp.]|uniref:OmpH family outer membrane protein n=1 Tax=Aquidulcibacter sp. TaxID=2052990 RepID=UPI0025BD0937|nr:OmpH family outer membrane protein [Aquidulcibacter sp.]MCA3692202.1 OmpH family outer membrane protein [Aquidulcibacter sp.]
MKAHYLMAGVAAFLAATSAQAQTPVPVPAPAPAAAAAPARPAGAPAVLSPVVVYDLGSLIQDSLAGQDMSNKLKAIRDQINRELEPDQRQLESELRAILASSVQESQSAAGRQRQEAFQRLNNEFQQKQERLSQVMQLTERNAIDAFNKAIAPVLQQTLVARNGLIAISANQVEAFIPGVDMTADLITRLNATTKTINVVRATLPTQGAPAAAPAAGAAPAAAPAGAPLPARPPAAAPRRP